MRWDVNRQEMKTSKLILISIFLCASQIVVFAQTPAGSTTNEVTKSCFECKGTGMAKCAVPSCRNGQANCPNPCLKPDDGTWVKMTVAGHPPTDVWKRFRKRDGSWTAWNQGHAGEVIQMQNGEPTNMGKCSVCGGTTKVKCKVCNGAGQVTCPIC